MPTHNSTISSSCQWNCSFHLLIIKSICIIWSGLVKSNVIKQKDFTFCHWSFAQPQQASKHWDGWKSWKSLLMHRCLYREIVVQTSFEDRPGEPELPRLILNLSCIKSANWRFTIFRTRSGRIRKLGWLMWKRSCVSIQGKSVVQRQTDRDGWET